MNENRGCVWPDPLTAEYDPECNALYITVGGQPHEGCEVYTEEYPYGVHGVNFDWERHPDGPDRLLGIEVLLARPLVALPQNETFGSGVIFEMPT